MLSEHGIDPAQFDYREEEVRGCDLNSQTNAQRPTAQHPRPSDTPSPEHHQPLGTTCFRLHNATHITQHNKKKEQKGRYSE
jgi:hypothetical protein